MFNPVKIPTIYLNNDQSAFWVNYTSLILIVLTFVIAVFFAPAAFRNDDFVKPTIVPSLGEMELDGVFESVDSSVVSEVSLSGLSFALLNHDLRAEVITYGETVEVALSRSIAIFKKLKESGVSSLAVTAYGEVVPGSKLDGKVVFYEAVL